MQQVAAQGRWFLEVALVEWWRVQPKNSSSAPPKLFMIIEISERIYFILPMTFSWSQELKALNLIMHSWLYVVF